ncbi:MAG: phosphomannomutase/phosphoglucomutase, partial [Proteobacteria bacterium]|nr:phosphomannomutase/phosphoglucomutase [Pseudomonadota bacterium]
MDPEIFKAYDVRGLYPEQLDAAAASAIGLALAETWGEGRVVVGRDMRASGEVLLDALVGSLRGRGVNVIDIGRVATPMVYFATRALEADGGVMITASHNPAAYNGLKLCGRAAVPIGIESGLAQIRDRALELHGESPGRARAELERTDIRAAYYASLLEMFPARPRLSLVVDAGNGIAGEALSGLLDQLPLRTERLFFEPDGRFPNHEADPLKRENLRDLQREVSARSADLGLALDGDGDRAVFVDEAGDPVPADLMTALLAEVVLEEGLLRSGPGSRLVYDLRSSRVVAETIRAHGSVAVRSRVGHAFMKARMREQDACFGGELSGHYYFRFPSGYVADDAAAALMLVLSALELRRRPLSELWRPFARYSQSGEINSRVDDVPRTLERVRRAFPAGEADELDGLTVSFPEWWFNLRPSNTEP